MAASRTSDDRFPIQSLYGICLETVLQHFSKDIDLSGIDEVSCEILLRALANKKRLTAPIIELFRALGHAKITELLLAFDTRLAVAGLSGHVVC